MASLHILFLSFEPINDKGSGLINWHQDYPFFPHTNFDLLAFGIHLDDEDENSDQKNTNKPIS